MTSIGIVGAGIAGLHLGLYLRDHDVPVTIYTDKSGDELAAGRLLNSVAHHHPTLERERQLGVHHWDAAEYGYVCHHHYLGLPQPLVFRGDFAQPSAAIDYRLYLPRLMGDFSERGGRVAIQAVQADDLDRLAGAHDLLVIASGRGTLGGLFGRRAEKSPYDKPQRRLSVALWHGVAPTDPKGVTLSISPGHGELIEIPIYSFDGHVTALLFENIPGGALEVLADLRYDEDPGGFTATVLQKLKEHHPAVYERVDPAAFAVTRPQDILQGALIPHMRADYTQLANGRYALSVGDVHAVVDPVVGQGANSASYSAWTVGEAIVADLGFDELFCQRVARRRADVVEGISDWTNFMLAPPAPNLIAMLIAMAGHQEICDEFTTNFGYGERQWTNLASMDRTRAYLAGKGVDMDALLASLPN